ncbi:MAG: hypothetical protein NVS3B7_09430 [Candidatus Elarobacter sp.]
MHSQRGQALIETAIFLPVALLALFAILYFGRFGVLEERAQSAVRYGATVSYETAGRYSAANLYATLAANAAPAGVCPAGVTSDTVTVLNGLQGGAPAQGYFTVNPTPSATCTMTTAAITGAAPEAFRYFAVTSHAVSGKIDVPSFLSSALGSSGGVAASLGYIHSDTPGLIVYCTAHVGASVAAALNATYTATGNC